MFIDKFSFFFYRCTGMKCPTSRIDCEKNFLSILEHFFQSCCIFSGKSKSAIKTVLEAIHQSVASNVTFSHGNPLDNKNIVMFFYDKTDFKILCMIRGKPLNPYFSGLYVAPLEVPAGWEVPGVSLKPTGDVARSFQPPTTPPGRSPLLTCLCNVIQNI